MLARLLAAVAAGLLHYLSFPPRTTWWLAPVAFAILGATLYGGRARDGFGYGLAFGLTFFLPLIVWTSSYVGALPWVALSVTEAVLTAVAGAAIAVVSRLPAAPLWAACVWVGSETLRSVVPFGGFPWGRVGFGQPEGVFLPVAALGGVPLLSFVVVLTGFALAELLRRLVASDRRWARLAVPAVFVALAVAAGPAAGALRSPASDTRSMTVAAIQGNVPQLGLDFNAQRRAVLDNHVARTTELAAEVAAGRQPAPQLVIWPENSSDIDPLRNPDARERINQAADAIGVPILVGAVLQRPDGQTTTNTALVWRPGVGPVERNDKRRVQPFGEYLPWRAFFRIFSSDADRAGYFVPGEGPGVVPMAGTTVGIGICWEVAFDDLLADSVRNGAELLTVPSNNATFGLTEMTYQQLAMSQVRAVEHDRAVVVAATSGVSAVVRPDGTIITRSGQFAPAIIVEQVPLRNDETLATRLGSVPGWLLSALGALVLVAAVYSARRRRTRHRPGDAAN